MADWWIYVFNNLKAPRDFRELGLCSKRGYILLKTFELKLRKRRQLDRLIRMFPDKPWNLNDLAHNPTVSWTLIEKVMLKQSYDTKEIRRIRNVWLKHSPFVLDLLMQRQPEEIWNTPQTFIAEWKSVSQNPHLTPDVIQQNITMSWNWNHLSSNKSISGDLVLQNLTKSWEYLRLSRNPSISWELVSYTSVDFYKGKREGTRRYKKKHTAWKWDWNELSQNPAMTCAIIEQNPDHRWDWNSISSNPSINLDFVNEHLDKPWNWFSLSCGLKMSMEQLQHNLHLPWEWDSLSCNHWLNFDVVKQNLDLAWDWSYLSRNPSITIDQIKQNPELRWNKTYIVAKCKTVEDVYGLLNISTKRTEYDINLIHWYIAARSPIIMDLIKTGYIEKWRTSNEPSHVWEQVSNNPNITWEFVMQNVDRRWDWSQLSLNTFDESSHTP